eukprot:CAMPEP_0201523410 /NCGR_PEP_ID=MMETSP0161_2-20130828/19713_1 /ASSEMBLY_ACC=CAM_ASM_000251 /TAXON_ID=180227 /ORGANISM="Neoparamoeba aestuarina, Strain SoJaBio B1-5/56/2" /LENGTH=166 /DNA_ID=CAMNT_0047922517 /DNA_START=96 /DNA_END=592 /DNA_ORIENTATION=+
MAHNLSNDAGLKAFNSFIEDKSYVNGFVPTSADFELLAEVKEAPAAKYVNALRWYNHVSSFSEEEKAAAQKAPAAGAAAPAEAKADDGDDDDDFDVFGDDDDDEEREAEIQRIADAAAAAKAAKGKVVIAKSVVVLDVKPWDTETDLKALEEKIRGIEMEGLEWKG